MKLTTKSAALAAAIMLVSLSAHAATQNFDGPYVGLQGGYEDYKIKDAASTVNADLGISGATGGVFVGYGKRFDNLYLGAEAEGSLSSIDDNVLSVGSAFLKYREKDSYGISLRPGFIVHNDTLLYGRIGFVRTDFEGETQLGSESKSLNGLRLGLGAETPVYQNISVRADWAYTDYQDDNAGAGRLSPTSNMFRVGVAYNF